jgi:hypothetical protein
VISIANINRLWRSIELITRSRLDKQEYANCNDDATSNNVRSDRKKSSYALISEVETELVANFSASNLRLRA